MFLNWAPCRNQFTGLGKPFNQHNDMSDDKFIDAKLERLKSFTTSLSLEVEFSISAAKAALTDSNEPPSSPFRSRESVALTELGGIEEKLSEVIAAYAAVMEALNNRQKAKKGH
jgi:hypothetical protein